MREEKPEEKLPEGIVIEQAAICHPEEMRALYQTGGWWEEGWTDETLAAIVRSSFLFIVARTADNHWIGMGRAISDAISDAYLQDIVVLPEWQGQGIGSAIVGALLSGCRERGLDWIGLIAEPEATFFYRKFGFAQMGGYTPMRFER